MWYEVEDVRLGELCTGATGEELTPLKKWSFGRLYGRLKKNGEPRSAMTAPYSIEVLYNGRPVGFLWTLNNKDGVRLTIKNQERRIRSINHGVDILTKMKTVTADNSELAYYDPENLPEFPEWTTDIYYKGELFGKVRRTYVGLMEIFVPVSPDIFKDLEDFSNEGINSFKIGTVSGLIYLFQQSEFTETEPGKCTITDIPNNLIMQDHSSAIRIMYRSVLKTEGEYRNPIFRSIFKCSEKELYERLTAGMPEGFDLNDYHVDHIVPVSSAKTVKELVRLNHFTNLRLLTKEVNHYKKATLPMESELPSDLNRSVRKILNRSIAESEE